MSQPTPTDSTHDDHPTDESAVTSMELNLRLDENFRTTYDPSLLAASLAAACGKSDDGTSSNCKITGEKDEHPSKRARIEIPIAIDYSSKSTTTNLSDTKLVDAMDSLLFDCEITDCGLLPRTFWVPAKGIEPRCFLEKLALEVFHHHVPQPSLNSNFFYDANASGAEWWVQIRPSPPAGRYSMLTNINVSKDKDDMAKEGISFHWDKDEDLRLMCGGSMYIHPHLSTVTYLTDLGAPTMVLSRTVNPMTGDVMAEGEDGTSGFISWPKKGKHLSFDGRYLHAAPSDLMEVGMFERQCGYEVTPNTNDKDKKITERRHRRVTFLVNVWLNYKPFNVNVFPETMLNSLSKVDLFGDFKLFGDDADTDKEQTTNVRVHITNDRATESSDKCTKSVKVLKKTWPMGSCDDDDEIEVPIPMEVVRNQALTRHNLVLSWAANTIQMSGQKGS